MKSWRDVLKIHPAAELFPLMSEAELRELAADIKEHGLQHPVVLTYDNDYNPIVLDGAIDSMRLSLLAKSYSFRYRREAQENHRNA